MRRFARLILLGLCAVTLGCGTLHFEALPSTPEEFELSMEELQERYPDAPVRSTIFPFRRANVSGLLETWGEPDMEKKDWWYFPVVGGTLILISGNPTTTVITGGLVLIVRPVSPRDYIWHKGSYCIVVAVDRTFPTYQALVAGWDWVDLRTAEKVPSNCRQFLEAEPEGEALPLSVEIQPLGAE